MKTNNWVVIRTEFFNLQAEILRGLLEANGIQVHLSSEGYQNAIGFDGPPHHQIEILVPEADEAPARALLIEYDAGKLENENGNQEDFASGEDPV